MLDVADAVHVERVQQDFLLAHGFGEQAQWVSMTQTIECLFALHEFVRDAAAASSCMHKQNWQEP
jgi:hypothetical protein